MFTELHREKYEAQLPCSVVSTTTRQAINNIAKERKVSVSRVVRVALSLFIAIYDQWSRLEEIAEQKETHPITLVKTAVSFFVEGHSRF